MQTVQAVQERAVQEQAVQEQAVQEQAIPDELQRGLNPALPPPLGLELLVICTIRFIPDEDAAYLEGAIMPPRLSPIRRLSAKPPPWELEPPCHSFLGPWSR
ncbi:hypothetical protein EYF80_002230 [Liparis tanakae]|uniref:Uncharacterized protein n=1 Tax=Liparis tanakae TaxID=230148 RepID=A0A4Z2JCL0_9TELE|nr:hypothetical protein EYF80_002230 [Liparis tanakae]